MDELTSAGITDPELRNSYLECKRLNNLHGKTYFLATRLLPPEKRPFVHALYGFARYADEIVDDLASTSSENEKAQSLKSWGDEVLANIKSGRSRDHIGAALVDTVNRFSIPISYFEAFLHSMTMDLTITEYHTYEDLYEYVYGSAAVIGLQMVPILGTVSKQSMIEANIAAEKLGIDQEGPLGGGQGSARLAQPPPDRDAARRDRRAPVRRVYRRRTSRRRTCAREGAHLQPPRRLRSVGSEESAPRAVEPLQRAPQEGRALPRVPDLQLDRARRLAVHQAREHRAAEHLLRARARRVLARRHALLARALHRAPAGRDGGEGVGPLPHRGRH